MSKAQIIALAEAGVAPAAIATQVGTSASYVSQVLSENSIKTKVLEAQLTLLDERTQRDARYDAIEDVLLAKMKSSLPSIYKPQDILRSLMAINKAERRGATSQQLAELANNKESTVIHLELPERVRTRILQSSSREIVSVNERALITKDSRLLLAEITSEPALTPVDPFDIDLPEGVPNELPNDNSSQANAAHKAIALENFFEHSSSPQSP